MVIHQFQKKPNNPSDLPPLPQTPTSNVYPPISKKINQTIQ